MMKQAEQLANLYKAGEHSHPLFAPLRSPEEKDLTPETFGTLMVLSWAAQRGPSDLPDPRTLARAFLAKRSELPSYAQDVLHAEPRVLGEPNISEYSEYMAAAQDAGLVKRYNPTHIRCHVMIGQLEAQDMLASYRESHSDLLDWLEERVKQL